MTRLLLQGIPMTDAAENNPENEIMCSCSGTTRARIFDLVMQGEDFERVCRRTGVNTGCGGCEWDIQLFVNALVESIDNIDSSKK